MASTRDYLKRIALLPSTIKYYIQDSALRFHIREFKEKHPNFQLPIFHKYLLVRFYLTFRYHSSFFIFLKNIILQSPAGSYLCHTDYIPHELKYFSILYYPDIEEDYKKFYHHFLENYNFKLFDFVNFGYDNMFASQFLDETFCECKGDYHCPIPRQDENQKYIYPYDLLGDLLYLDPELTESDDDDEITVITNSPADSPDVSTTTDDEMIAHSPCNINIEDFQKKRKRNKKDGLCPRDAKYCATYARWAGELGQADGNGVLYEGDRRTRYGRISRSRSSFYY